jgi:hypothetical protein
VLTQYTNLTQQLLQNPQATSALYSTSQLQDYINIARGQLAGESESIRVEGTLICTVGQRNYNFSSITLDAAGVQGAIHVRRIAYGLLNGGRRWVTPRPWPYFDLYYLSSAVVTNGPPLRWAQYGQGSAGSGTITGVGAGSLSSGSFYLDPPPDQTYLLYLDCVCYPIALALDGDPEAIPYLWTDAVPFYAAWYALLTAQNNIRMEDAKAYKDLYDDFVKRARAAANASVNRYMYAQAFDPAQAAKVGAPQGGGAGARGGVGNG